MGALGDLDDDVVAVARTMSQARTDLDRIPMTGVLRLDAAGSVAGVENAPDLLRPVAGALDEARDAAAAVVHANRQHFDPVVVHQGGGIGARQGQRRRTIVRKHQHVAVGAAAHPSRHALALSGGREARRTLDGLSVAHHRCEAFGQRVTLFVGVQSEPLREPRGGQGFRRLRQMLEQQFAARDRIGIAQFFELEIRILTAPVRLFRGAVRGIGSARVFWTTSCHRISTPCAHECGARG